MPANDLRRSLDEKRPMAEQSRDTLVARMACVRVRGLMKSR